MYDILIIGGGPGGIYASIMASLNGLKSCIIETLPFLGGQPNILYPLKDIYDFPGFSSITGGDIIAMLIDQMNSLQNNKPDVFLNTHVNQIKKNKSVYIVSLSDEKIIKTKSIVISTGMTSLSPKKIIINEKEIEQNNIKYIFESNDHYKDLDIVILGGGDSALDWAIHLDNKKISKKVYLIHRTDILRARKDKIEQMTNSNIDVNLNYFISKITDNKILIINNVDNKSKEIHFDKILVQYGFNPTKNKFSELLNNIELHNNKIIVNETFESSIEMIYAIGQATTYVSKPNLIVVSMSEAAKAIYSITWKLNNNGN